MLSFFLLPFYLQASHIVGGDMSYRFVSRQGKKVTFHFTMKIYRDRFTPTGVTFDDFAAVSVYAATPSRYVYYGTDSNSAVISPPRSPIHILDPPTYPCLVPPDNIGVDEVSYEWDVTVMATRPAYYHRRTR